MSRPRAFQTASVDAALKAFANPAGQRRFLVADEVGLGKTVIAREVASGLPRNGRRPFVVYYIANGHSVAHQNKERVVAFLDESERQQATDTPDRLSLMAMAPPPSAQVLVYALTPATSFPGAQARLGGGRKDERAFLKVLLDRAYPGFARGLPKAVLRLGARSSWKATLKQAKARFAAAPPGLVRAFRRALATEFGEPVRGCLERVFQEHRLRPAAFVGRLRRALALAALKERPPDLIVLDEFQRYRQLLQAPEKDVLLRALLGLDNPGARPAVLLLSATPYRALASGWNEGGGELAHSGLMELIEFLGGRELREQARHGFAEFAQALREIAAQPSSHAQRRAEQGRDRLRELLAPVMCRTERDSVAGEESVAKPPPLRADPSVEDIQAYRHLAEIFPPRLRHEALPYWSSVPLAAQSLGPGYAAWKQRDLLGAKRPKIAWMTHQRRAGLQAPPGGWPDAKLRALEQIAAPRSLALPWVAPSLPWWPLAGAWQSQPQDPKLLLFSRYRATPPSVAALMSFGVEAHCLPKGQRDERAYRRRRIKLSTASSPALAAFHPSAWLIANTDPLETAGASLAEVRRRIKQQLLRALPKGIVDRRTAKARQRHRPVASVLASIERWAGSLGASAPAWQGAVRGDRAAEAAIAQWCKAAPIERLSPLELADLVEHALAAPGVVLGRALYRHDRRVLQAERYPELVRLSWRGLRAYLDNPVILAALPKASAVERIMAAVVDGGMESMLDEHFWMRAQALPDGAAGLIEELQAALGLRVGSFRFHPINHGGKPIPVRCHAAVPFGEAGDPADPSEAARAARPDEVRVSFNTPFWPHVLTTTSVGQEGLDFHCWCSRVLHWDLPSSPLDLEQREGRVQRFAGLAIRRELARRLRAEVLAEGQRTQGSPWRAIQDRAERFADPSGLRPWWVLEGADIQRHVFHKSFGRDRIRFDQLRRQRTIYRLALGQPNQEDFVEMLARGNPDSHRRLRALVLDLSAMGLRKLQVEPGAEAVEEGVDEAGADAAP